MDEREKTAKPIWQALILAHEGPDYHLFDDPIISDAGRWFGGRDTWEWSRSIVMSMDVFYLKYIYLRMEGKEKFQEKLTLVEGKW